MNSNGMYSIIVDEGQFVESNYDIEDEVNNAFYNEPKQLVDFKKRCKKTFGNSAVIQYGGGQLEIILSEDNFATFQQIADDMDVEFDIGEVIEF